MTISVNGLSQELAADNTLAALVALLELTGKRIAIEVNEVIVPRSLYAQTLLQDGDCVEIVHAIGGG